MNIYHPQPDDRYESIMRLIDWKRGGPYIFKKEDFEDLVTSPMLFARKFDQREDNVIITKLVMYLQNTKNDRWTMVVPEKLRTLDRGRPWRDSQFASTRLSPSRDMSR